MAAVDACVSISAGAGEDPGEVLGLLREQAAMFFRLEQFAARQRALVRADDAGPLLSLLADRQKLSGELTRLGVRLAPVRRIWPVFRERLDARDREEADRLLRSTTERLQRVIEGDERDARLLLVKKERVKEELGATHAVGRALSAYRTPVERGARATRLDEAS